MIKIIIKLLLSPWQLLDVSFENSIPTFWYALIKATLSGLLLALVIVTIGHFSYPILQCPLFETTPYLPCEWFEVYFPLIPIIIPLKTLLTESALAFRSFWLRVLFILTYLCLCVLLYSLVSFSYFFILAYWINYE
jgi:hypothetical protein